MKQITAYVSDDFTGVKALEVSAPHLDVQRERGILNIYPEVTYQTVLGFGGAFTESAAYCYSTLNEEEKQRVIAAYFSEEGLAYRLCRTHINSCDFSLDRYVYVEDGDTTLESFSIQRDKQYIIPFIKDALAYTGEDMMLFASPWSAPAWMKTNDSVVGGGKIKPEYLALWAEYYCKYIHAFAKEGISISAISVQNEPKAIQPWESCEFSAEDEGVFVRDYLVPALEKNGLSHIKILIWDHNKERVYDRARDTFSVPGVREKVWGIGFHWYSGHHYEGVGMCQKMFPEKMLIESEYCKVLDPRYENFGADENPLSYAEEIHGNFVNGMHGSVDWNLLLDRKGGPCHDRTSGCRAPLMVDTERGTFTFTNLYYNIYHFAHFIKVGAVRVGASTYDDQVMISAFQNPDGTIVAVVVNRCDAEAEAHLRLGSYVADCQLPPKSVSSFVIEM